MPQQDNGAPTLIQRIASMNKALTLEDVAALLNFSYRKAWEMAANGRIPAMQIGSAWRIDSTELAEWLRQQQTFRSTVPNSLPRGRSHRLPAKGSAVRTPGRNGLSTSSPSGDPCHLATAS
jgi:excisionase family DNA binding protein